MEEIRKIVGLGRKSNETYRQFALRIHHDVTMLGIKDDNEVIIDALLDKVPDGVYNDMLITLRISKNARCRFTSIKDFTDILSDMAGPTMDVGTQRPMADDYLPRSAPRNNRGASNGANRNRTFGRHRFNPAQRSPTQSVPATQQDSLAPRGRQHCNNCGLNNTHSTAECVQCTFCHKKGHTADVCRARPQNNQGNNNGNNMPWQNYTPTNKGENASPEKLSALKTIDPGAHNHHLALYMQPQTQMGTDTAVHADEQMRENEKGDSSSVRQAKLVFKISNAWKLHVYQCS
jgi:hypothetical protein